MNVTEQGSICVSISKDETKAPLKLKLSSIQLSADKGTTEITIPLHQLEYVNKVSKQLSGYGSYTPEANLRMQKKIRLQTLLLKYWSGQLPVISNLLVCMVCPKSTYRRFVSALLILLRSVCPGVLPQTYFISNNSSQLHWFRWLVWTTVSTTDCAIVGTTPCNSWSIW